MVSSDVFVSVCMVTHNDSSTVSAFIPRIVQILTEHFQFHELIVVDNHSLDDTSEIIQKIQASTANVRLIRLSRRYALDTALTAGLENSIGDYVVIIDPLTDSPKLIAQMVAKAQEGYDIVIVKRPEAEKYRSLVDRVLALVLYKVLYSLLHIEIKIDDTHYRLFSRQVVNSLSRIRHKRRYLRYFNTVIGFRQASILDEQSAGHRTPQPVFPRVERMLTAADLIISTSAIPLRLASLFGLLASGINLLYFGYIIAVTLIKDKIVEGWITTSVMSTLMFFILFVILTILTEYIARLLEEIKDHPLYFIEYETSSPTSSYSQIIREEPLNIV